MKEATFISKEQKYGWKPEWAALIIFIAAYLVMCIFHEPWFDEAQAWQIGKCASLKDILFLYPHYEGHPAFWSLILAIPAKLGVPFEVGLKTVGGIAAAILCWLIVFKTNFPRLVRLLLPFSYFVFYQYVVVVRPYSIMLIAMILVGLSYKDKDTKPWKIVLSLMLLCMTCAYGIVMAGGIAIAYVIDIFTEYGWKGFWLNIWKDRRFVPLFTLLVFALILIASIIPADDVFALAIEPSNTFFERILFCLIGFLGESTVINSIATDRSLSGMDFSGGLLISSVLAGLIVWLVILCNASRKNLKYFVFPQVLFSLLAAMFYAYAHHLGISFFTLIYWAIIAVDDDNRGEFIKNNELKKISQRFTGIFVGVTLLLALIWNGMSFAEDILMPYSFGRGTAAFLEDSGLLELNIMIGWQSKKEEQIQEGQDIYDAINIYDSISPSTYLAYFDYNISYSLNGGKDSQSFKFHKNSDREENIIYIEWLRTCEAPDVLIFHPDVDFIFDGQVDFHDYVPVYEIEKCGIWKGEVDHDYDYIYLRRDLLDKYGLEPVDKKFYVE